MDLNNILPPRGDLEWGPESSVSYNYVNPSVESHTLVEVDNKLPSPPDPLQTELVIAEELSQVLTLVPDLNTYLISDLRDPDKSVDAIRNLALKELVQYKSLVDTTVSQAKANKKGWLSGFRNIQNTNILKVLLKVEDLLNKSKNKKGVKTTPENFYYDVLLEKYINELEEAPLSPTITNSMLQAAGDREILAALLVDKINSISEDQELDLELDPYFQEAATYALNQSIEATVEIMASMLNMVSDSMGRLNVLDKALYIVDKQ